MKPLSLIFIMLLVALASTAIVAAEIYKWQDESGNIFYGQTPPAKYKAELVGEPPPPPSLATDANQPYVDQIEKSLKDREREKAMQQQAEQLEQQARNDEAVCLEAKENLMKMHTWRRARTTGPDGQLVMMGEEERQAKISEAQEVVDQVCK